MSQVKVVKINLYRIKCAFCEETSPPFSEEMDALAWASDRSYERHKDQNYCKSCRLLQRALISETNGKSERLITKSEAVAEKAKLLQNRSFVSNEEIIYDLEGIITGCSDLDTEQKLTYFSEMLDKYLIKTK